MYFKLFICKVNPHPFLIENGGTAVNCRLVTLGRNRTHRNQTMLHPLNFAFRVEKVCFPFYILFSLAELFFPLVTYCTTLFSY